MYSLNRLRYAPLKEIVKSGITSGLVLALMGGIGLPVGAQQTESVPSAGATSNAETTKPTEASAELNLNDDYYTMEKGGHATFYPFENDNFNSNEVGHFTLNVLPGPEIEAPMTVNWFMPLLNGKYVLMMQFHNPATGDYTVKYSITPHNEQIEPDEATVHLHVYDPEDRVALYLPQIQKANTIDE